MATVVKKAAPAKKVAKKEVDGIYAYCMKTKEKNVLMIEPVINKNDRGYVAIGCDEDGNKMAAILGAEKALAFIESGVATKGTGFAKAKK